MFLVEVLLLKFSAVFLVTTSSKLHMYAEVAVKHQTLADCFPL